MPLTQADQDRKRSRWGETIFSRTPRLARRSWTLVGAAIFILLTGFLAGSYYNKRHEAAAGAGGRTAIYYVDPMNPAHTSPVPGLAPCGMKMEPVYADEVGDYPDASLAPGTVRVTPRKQQLIGVRSATVEKAPFTYTFRALGKVAVDETRIYRMNAAIDGWIREVGDNSTGSVVQKGETLAVFYSPEFLSAQQAYIYAGERSGPFSGQRPRTPGPAPDLPGKCSAIHRHSAQSGHERPADPGTGAVPAVYGEHPHGGPGHELHPGSEYLCRTTLHERYGVVPPGRPEPHLGPGGPL